MTTNAQFDDIATEAAIFLYPLVLMDLTRRQLTSCAPGQRPGRGPADGFVHIRSFPSAQFREVVRPNFDTLYSSAWLDLRHEPRIVTAPDTDGRYYLLPMYDMWTDAFAVPGSRTTGTAAKTWAVCPPGWTGELPDGVSRIDAPTPWVWVIGRTQTNGPADYAAVHAVQDGYIITPLSAWGKGPYTPPVDIDPTADLETEPLAQVRAMSPRDFFTYAAELLQVHPTHTVDWSMVQRMRQLGLEPGQPLDWDALTPEARAALEQAPDRARAAIAAQAPHMGRVTNGWLMLTDSMGVYGTFYNKRAFVAAVGLGANVAEDAIYPLLQTDADGQPLDGSNDYVIHFPADALPPCSAFWSVTMYDVEGFQVANELDRFAIGDRDPLTFNDDGSLDIWLQHANPGPDRVTNWLPAPEGPLGVTMRLYAPKHEALDGRWNPPAVRKL
jgi:hypothetical protein